MKEKNAMMEAINSMKAALSQIEKEYTMQDTNMESEENDGNMGQAEGGEQSYEAMDYNSKKKMLVKKLSNMGE